MKTIKDARSAVKLSEKIDVLEKAVDQLEKAEKDVLVTIHLSHGIHLDLEPSDVLVFSDVLKNRITANRLALTTLGFE
jgi:hypothetical protein